MPPRPLASRRSLRAVVLVVALSALLFGLLQQPNPEAPPPPNLGQRLDAGTGESPRLSSPPRTHPPDVTECTWFSRWASLAPDPREVPRLLVALRADVARRTRCLPDPWLLLLTRARCDGTVEMPAREVDALGGAWTERGPRSAAWALGADTEGCVLSLLAETADAGSLAHILSALGEAYSGDGLLSPNERLIDQAARLLALRSLHDSGYWTDFWSGIEDGAAGIHLRRAIYEAAIRDADEPAIVDRLHFLADLEQSVGGSASASTALAAMGMAMQGRLDASVISSGLAWDRSVNWKRALLWSIGPGNGWPEKPLPWDGRSSEMIVRFVLSAPESPGARYYRLELVERLFEVLGPIDAARAFTSYRADPYASVPETIEWLSSGLRFTGAETQGGGPAWRSARATVDSAIGYILEANRWRLDSVIVALLDKPDFKPAAGAREALVRLLDRDLDLLEPGTRARLAH